jgi:hypothetical protein
VKGGRHFSHVTRTICRQGWARHVCGFCGQCMGGVSCSTCCFVLLHVSYSRAHRVSLERVPLVVRVTEGIDVDCLICLNRFLSTVRGISRGWDGWEFE